MFSINHVANGSDQNSKQIFNLLANALNVIKNNYEHINGAHTQCDGAGCYKTLGLLVRLGLAEPKLDVPITEYNHSESNDGKDMCDRFISTKKKNLRNAASSYSDCKNVNDAVNTLETMVTLKGKYFLEYFFT